MPLRLVFLIGNSVTFLLSQPEPAISVSERDGNIYAGEQRLTDSGLDSEPALSPDQRFVAFVRSTPDRKIDTALGATSNNELWVASLAGLPALRRILKGSALTPYLDGFNSPFISADSRSVFFLSAFSATAGALWVVGMTDPAPNLLVPGATSFKILVNGPYRGKLIVQERNWCGEGELSHACYPYWLFSSDGVREKRIAEEDDADLDMLVRKYSVQVP